MNLRTGEVIKSGYYTGPWFHYGIVIILNNQVYIAHNSPKSDNGGYPTLHTLEDFLKTRYIKKSFGVMTHDSVETLLKRLQSVEHKKFSYVSWNCEDFVNYMIGREFFFKTGKIVTITGIILALVIIIILIRKRL